METCQGDLLQVFFFFLFLSFFVRKLAPSHPVVRIISKTTYRVLLLFVDLLLNGMVEVTGSKVASQ